MSTNTTLRKGEKTRQIFIEAGARVFLRDGYLNTEISEIAREAGKSNGTFYIYFTNKSDLLDAMYDQFVEDSMLKFKLHDEPWYGHMQPENWHAILHNMWDTCKTHAATFYALAQAALIDEHFAEVSREIRARTVMDFERIIKGRQSAGFAQGLDPHYAAVSLEILVLNCLNNWLARPEGSFKSPAEEDRAFGTLVKIFDSVLG
jgi:AcrR family transcriptional regulator